MRKIYGVLLGLVLLLTAISAFGADVIGPMFYFNDSVPGQRITIQGTFTDPGNRKVVLEDVSSGVKRDLDAIVPATGDRLSFDLPTDLNNGRYKVTIKLTGEAGAQAEVPVPGELRIPSPPGLKVTVDTVQPVSPYPNPAHQNAQHQALYDFEIAGTNFAPDLANNYVEINGLPIEIDRFPNCDAQYKKPCLIAPPDNVTRKLRVEGYNPPGFSHPLEVSVRVGKADNVAKAPAPVVFSQISKTRLQIYAVGVFVALLGILYFLVRAGIKLGKINGEKYGSLRAFLIDKETNSYSLSKFQLTLFTLVTIFGYIYVFVCRLFVQWVFELPPVPEGLPTMLGVSVGTSVVAAGIGAKIGGKGAGPESPSVADFICSGGVVLPERFQFFLWTIVSSFGVLALILASDPVTITALPKLPEGMLYLMGLSSAGYLGGKLVRGPGPSIKSLDAKVSSDKKSLVVVLAGDNLSKDATFQFDDERIPTAQVSAEGANPDAQNPNFFSKLTVTFTNIAERYFDQPHLFRIINPDSQGADIKYGTTIESVSKIDGEAGKLLVTGTNFKDPSKAQWFDTATSTTPKSVPQGEVTKKSDTELVLNLGKDVLPALVTIISPAGLKTTFDVALQKHVSTPDTTPAVKTPVVETPVIETPVVEAPVVETPVVETPVVETPTTDAPPSTDEGEVS